MDRDSDHESATSFVHPSNQFFWDHTNTPLMSSGLSTPPSSLPSTPSSSTAAALSGNDDLSEERVLHDTTSLDIISLLNELQEERERNRPGDSGNWSLFGSRDDCPDFVSVDMHSTDQDGEERYEEEEEEEETNTQTISRHCCRSRARWVGLFTNVGMVGSLVVMLVLPIGEGQGPWPFGEVVSCYGNNTIHDIESWVDRRWVCQMMVVGMVSSVLVIFLLNIARWGELIKSRLPALTIFFFCTWFSMLHVVLLPYECAQKSETAAISFACSVLFCLLCIVGLFVSMWPTAEDRQMADIETETSPLLGNNRPHPSWYGGIIPAALSHAQRCTGS